jgi:hypothetical protein
MHVIHVCHMIFNKVRISIERQAWEAKERNSFQIEQGRCTWSLLRGDKEIKAQENAFFNFCVAVEMITADGCVRISAVAPARMGTTTTISSKARSTLIDSS